MGLFRLISCCGAPIEGPGAPGSDAQDLEWTSETEYSAPSGSESWVAECSRNFDQLDAAIALLVCDLSALTRQSADSATYRIRIDGTPGAPDGAILVSLTTANAAYVVPPGGATGPAFARPPGRHLLKLTIEPITVGITNAYITAFGVLVTEA